MKKKILHIIGKLSTGGAENMAMNFCRYSNKELFQYDYLVFGSEIGNYEKEAIENGANVIHIDNIKVNYLKYIINLWKIIKLGNYDAVHAHLMLNNGITMLIARLLKVNVRISHSHSTSYGRSMNILYKSYEFLMKKLIVSNATKLIACGQEAGEYLYGIKKFKKEGIIINNSIDLDKYIYNEKIRRCIKENYNLGNNKIVGHIGRLTKVKNHKFLIEIFRNMLKIDSNLMLIIVGDGELRDEIYSYVRKYSLDEKVILTGNISNISEVLQVIDLVIFPSLYEGIPVAIIEAQAAGIPCLLSSTIDKETKINTNIEFIKLEESVELWGKSAINLINNRVYNNEKMRERGFDIKNTIIQNERIYEC